MSEEEARTLARLSLGRVLRLLSRPGLPGDVAQYEDARRAFYAAMDALGRGGGTDHEVICWVRDRLRGAAGD